MLNETDAQQNGQEINEESAFTFPPIAGFWRRLFAWLIDTLLLGIVGQILAVPFSSFFFSIGPYGRLIGLLFIIPYFGILNSRIGGGQTLGKRLLKIAVRNQQNEPIGLGRSILRISILALPTLLNGWSIPILENYGVAWFATLIVFGLGGAILYTMLFNRKTRQGLHDLLLGTYVVNLSGQPIEAFPVTPRSYWKVTGAWLGIVAVGTLAILVIAPNWIAKTPLGPVLDLQTVLQADPRFFGVGVSDLTVYASTGKTRHSLNIEAWYKGSLADSNDKRQEVADSIAKIVLENAKNIDQYDSLQIKLTFAYDIGIASGSVSFSYAGTIEEWRKKILSRASSNRPLSLLMTDMPAFP